MFDTSRLLDDALARVAPRVQHAMVLGEALRNAGVLDVPNEVEAFRDFVQGPLTLAAKEVLGAAPADALRLELLALTSVGGDQEATVPLGRGTPAASPPVAAPNREAADKETVSYGAPSSRKRKVLASTLGYGDKKPNHRFLALIDSDRKAHEQFAAILGARGHRVMAVTEAKKAITLCEQLRIDAVVANEHEAEHVLSVLRDAMGPRVPPMILLGDDVSRELPEGALRVLPKSFDNALVTAIEMLLDREDA